MKKSKFEKEVMISAVQEYLDGESSQRAIANRLGIHGETFRQWVKNYQAMGTDAFGGHKNKRYSKEMKEQAVRDYISGRGSLMDLCEKYKIKSTSQLSSWIKKYNGHE